MRGCSGVGCSAVNPYLAFETIDGMMQDGLLTNLDHKTACKNFVKAATKGVIHKNQAANRKSALTQAFNKI